MKKNLIKIICAITSLLVIFACASCDIPVATAKSNCSTSWEVVPYTQGESLYQYKSTFSLTRNSKTVKEIWINVSAIRYDTVTLTVSLNSGSETSSSPKYTLDINKSVLSGSAKGWLCIKDGLSQSYSYGTLTTTGGITINEILFVDQDNNKLPISFKEANLMYKNAKGEAVGKNGITSSEITNLGLTSSPLNLIDEQGAFDQRNN